MLIGLPKAHTVEEVWVFYHMFNFISKLLSREAEGLAL
ncbi:hypothetical protein J2S09_004274 [Bacillus fengqiuensis]|nr:hypothetical protein [Bacillus fengqiuensis]